MSAANNGPLKIVVIGDFSVGKSSITRRYVTGAFSENYRATVGAAILNHKVQTDRGTQTLVLFDLEGGLDRLDKLAPFLRGAHGAVVVADSTQIQTIENIDAYVSFLRTQLPGCPIAFALNKVDLPESLPNIEATCARLGQAHDLMPDASAPSALPTSALSGEGLDGLFAALLERLDVIVVDRPSGEER